MQEEKVGPFTIRSAPSMDPAFSIRWEIVDESGALVGWSTSYESAVRRAGIIANNRDAFKKNDDAELTNQLIFLVCIAGFGMIASIIAIFLVSR